jgi:cellulose synthase/poly-beta-1,6-N-acetylglucosamine synthase-like glycosyltransferase
VVIIAAAKEGREIIEPGIEAMAKGTFPSARIVPVLAIEERAGESQKKMAEALREKYRKHFLDFLVTVHPDGVPGEARVKGANVTFAGKEAAAFLKGKKISFEDVIVSCFDADTVASKEYFAALTYHFMRNPKRTRSSFQPIPVYHNNILEAPAFVRVLETGSSFFQLIEATNPEKLVTFSSHSMSFKALVDIGFWPVDMISDDSAIFWKALIYYGGDYRVVPMYVTLSMDVIVSETLWKTLVSVYRQKRRWAWGVENFPVVMRAFMKDSRIGLYSKFKYTVKLLEMHISWATLGFLITFIGWLPGIFAGREFSNSVLYYNSAHITGLIFNLASATLIVTIILALFLLPKQKARYPFLKRLLFASEWLLIPFIFTFLSSLPALDAQTRLAFGRMMEFRVTEKNRTFKSQKASAKSQVKSK